MIFAPYSEEKYIIPDGVEKIDSNAFGYNSKIKEVTIPSSVKSIEKFAFEVCTNLEKINFNKGLKRIEECAFIDCHALKSVKFPDSLRYIGDNAFNNCSSLEKVEFSSNTKQGIDAFAYTPYNENVAESPVSDYAEESNKSETSVENDTNNVLNYKKIDSDFFTTFLIIIGVIVLGIIIVIISLIVINDNKNKHENNQW